MNNDHELTLRITAMNHAIAAIEIMSEDFRTPEELEAQRDKIYQFYKDADSKDGNVVSLGTVN